MTDKPIGIEDGRLGHVSLMAIAGLFVGMAMAVILEVLGMNPGIAIIVLMVVAAVVLVMSLFETESSQKTYATLASLMAAKVSVCIVVIATGNDSVGVWIFTFLTVVFGAFSFLGALMPKDFEAD